MGDACGWVGVMGVSHHTAPSETIHRTCLVECYLCVCVCVCVCWCSHNKKTNLLTHTHTHTHTHTQSCWKEVDTYRHRVKRYWSIYFLLASCVSLSLSLDKSLLMKTKYSPATAKDEDDPLSASQIICPNPTPDVKSVIASKFNNT